MLSRNGREPYLTHERPTAREEGGRSDGTPREHARWDATPRDASMPSLMPSLLKYFTIVGGVPFVGLIGMSAMMGTGRPGPTLVKVATKVVLLVDPHALK